MTLRTCSAARPLARLYHGTHAVPLKTHLSFTSAAVGCRVIATDIRPDLGPFGEEPKAGVKNKVPGSVLMSFHLDSEPKREKQHGACQGSEAPGSPAAAAGTSRPGVRPPLPAVLGRIGMMGDGTGSGGSSLTSDKSGYRVTSIPTTLSGEDEGTKLSGVSRSPPGSWILREERTCPSARAAPPPGPPCRPGAGWTSGQARRHL